MSPLKEQFNLSNASVLAQRREPFRDRRGPTDQSLTILSGRGGFAGKGGGSGSLIGATLLAEFVRLEGV